MAFRHIPGNSQYEYDNAPPDPGVGHPMRALWQKSANGIRTEHGQSNYVRCRRIGSGDVDHGEISKSYWDLRSSVSSYAILALEPSFILDFKASVFNKNRVSSTFGASITHAATTNATMVGSDGLLKWRPHNLLTHSGDLTNAGWSNNRLTVTTGQNDFKGNPTAFKMTPTAVSGTHLIYKTPALSNLVNGILTTVTIDLKADGYNFFSVGSENNRYAIINLSDGTVSLNTGSASPTVTSLGNGWYRCSITTSANLQEVFSVVETPQAVNYGATTFTGNGTSGVLVAYPHTHRSDLGGMVNNPDRGDSYVPTTTSAVYLSRRGHHVYNSSAWVNEGILHESEARTNLMTYSNDLAGTDWAGGGSIVGAVTAGSPFGTYQTFSPSASGATPARRYQVGKTLTSGATYVGWSLVKYSAGSGWFALSMNDTGKGDERAWFDLQNGVVGTKEPLIIDHGMVDYGDGWWLCWASSNAASTSGGCVANIPNGDGVISRTQTDVILIAGTQFELASTPSSYIPTTTATVTRAAETLTVPAANLPWPTAVETTGTELVTNGTFDTDLTGWSASTQFPPASFVRDAGGTMTVTGSGAAYGSVNHAVTCEVGKLYAVSADITGAGYISSSSSQAGWSPTNNITSFIATATTMYIVTATGGANVVTFDNISVKEITPLALSIQMDGKMTYADNALFREVSFVRWVANGTNYIESVMATNGFYEGRLHLSQRQSTSGLQNVYSSATYFTPDVNVPFNFAVRHGSTFINGAEGGTALTADTAPTILPDLSATDLLLGNVFMGTIGEFRMWSDDLGDVGITEATLPSTEPSLSLTFDGSENSFIVLDWSE